METFLGEYKYSMITDEFPDKEKFPLYYQASKHEFTIGPGEKLFIPAGWFHFVFSEDVDNETRLNFAVNYWYSPENNWSPGTASCLLPRIEPHDIHINIREVCGNTKIQCTRSELDGLFPSDRVFHKFPRKCWNEFMTFDEFYQTKNPKYYIIQNETSNTTRHAPIYTTELTRTSSWINFGHVRSLMHFDEFDNWLCQIQGTKRVLLFPHEERHMLYMFNPLPIPLIKEIHSFYNSPRYFISIDNALSINFCDKYYTRTGTLKETEITDVCIHEVNKYNQNKMVPANIQMPHFDISDNSNLIDTEGIGYTTCQKYPLSIFLIIDGNGVINIINRCKVVLRKGDVVIFPNHFTFPWGISGNLKFIVPS